MAAVKIATSIKARAMVVPGRTRPASRPAGQIRKPASRTATPA
jgi:hypothetical protein